MFIPVGRLRRLLAVCQFFPVVLITFCAQPKAVRIPAQSPEEEQEKQFRYRYYSVPNLPNLKLHHNISKLNPYL